MVQYLFQGVAAFRRKSRARKRRCSPSPAGGLGCATGEAMTTEPGTDQAHSPPGLAATRKPRPVGARPRSRRAAALVVSLVLAVGLLAAAGVSTRNVSPDQIRVELAALGILTQSSPQGIA